MAGEAAFGTNNPFRRKTAASAADPALTTSTFPSASSAADPSDAVSSVFADEILQPEPQQPRPGIDHFQKHLQSLPQSATPPPLTTFAKPKPVKKVRVQSPPPSSPESISANPEFPAPGDAGGYDSDTSSSSDDDESSPEIAGRSGISRAWPESVREGALRVAAQAPPQNPFQRTLEDMEPTSRETPSSPSVGAAGKGGMDVSSFGRLLLTGQAEMRAPASQPSQPQQPLPLPAIPGDAASMTDASSVSRQSIFDATYATPETPRTSHEISESGDDDLPSHSTPKPRHQSTPATLRKKPPPPDSRHGKLIKIELKDNEKKPYTTEVERRPGSASSSSTPSKQATPTTPSDVNKPLPPAPSRNAADDDDESDSVFDREAAGKVPEIVQDPEEIVLAPRPPTPPNASHSATPKNAAGSKKPPPPPRRNTHGRSDTRPVSSSSNNSALPPTPQQPHSDADHNPPRSSLDSTRSRSSSIRVNINAPAPPPPRRPTHARGMSQTFASPSSAASFPSNMASSASSPSALSDAERTPFGSLASPDVAEEGAKSPEAASSTGAPARQAGPTTSMPASASASTLSVGPPPTLHPHLSTTSSSASQSKLSPPPPPPARNSSVRAAAQHSAAAVSPGGAGRPPSVSSLDAVSRRIGATKENTPGSGPAMAPPPPPPPRHRGNSRSSLESAPAGGGAMPPPRRTSVDSVRVLGGNVAEEPAVETLREEEGMEMDSSLAATDILADLDALKREVDAARAGVGGGGA